MNIETIFEERKNNPYWNTSYPLSPDDWAKYRVNETLQFADEQEISFYIHIPFCKQLCTFCEYTRMICPQEYMQNHYIEAVGKDIQKFKSQNNSLVLKGFDIGGGTPTSLSESCFFKLLDIYDEAISGIELSDDFEPSIEGTFSTLSISKIRRIAESGIHRLSLGMQTSNSGILINHHREKITTEIVSEWMNEAYSAGIKKINIDLMYGLVGQNVDTIKNDLVIIKKLLPEQVTLYELRTNMIQDKEACSKEKLFDMYKQYYDGLISIGYYAHFGRNTFSMDMNDLGVSSYLRSRMVDGVSYKGFGISAQSMNSRGTSYNIGKNNPKISKLLNQDTYTDEYVYLLPYSEIASKYIAISGYFGSFSLDKVLSKADSSYKNYIFQVLNFCLERKLVVINKNRVQITENGFKYYGAVFSLFYFRQF